MSTYVFESLLATRNCEPIGADALEDFVGGSGARALFLTGDVVQRPEAGDVAVVMREILRSPDGACVRLGVVDRRDEEVVMKRFGVLVLPAVVLLCGGEVREIIGRIRDWEVYTQAFARLAAVATTVLPL